MSRPDCVVRVAELRGELRPRVSRDPGLRAHVRELGPATGLTRLGVTVRAIPPGWAGTPRHFHEVEEEWVFVLSGRGTVRVGPLRRPVRAGSFVGFPPGPRPHHFIATGRESLVLLEGGERRRDEDRGRWVDAGLQWAEGREVSRATQPPPPEEGEASQCVHVESLEPRRFDHEVDARAHRSYRSLHAKTGLERQAVRWSRVVAGDRSTAYHMHERTDEWVFLLEGRARLRVGDRHCKVSSGDFVGHPAGGEPHVMEPETDLVYLMGGGIDPADVVVYPEAGVRRRDGRIEPLAST